jgi:NlpC/P60 family putative phage cell wall peptidase
MTVERPAPTAPAEAVIAAARSWLGTPYHDQASVRGVGCDCLGLARGVWRDVVGPEPFPVPPYSRDWGEVGAREVLADSAGRMLLPAAAGAPEPGMLLIFRMRDRAVAKHIGVLTERETFIHAYERIGVVEQALTDAWRRRVAFVFRFPSPSGRT